MKRMPLFSAALILVAAATFTSCKPSRVWATKDKDKDRDHDRVERNEKYDRDYDRNYDREERVQRYEPAPPPPPAPRRLVALVISPTPGFVMNQSSDGRYYHRSPSGLLYWKGYDNRFCLDIAYIRRVSYTQYEYEQWKRFSNQR